MTLTTDYADTAEPGTLGMLWLEITGQCQLECRHCYAGSGPDGDHGTMTTGDWERVIGQAAGLGTRIVQFIGGEPTLHPDLPRLIRHALERGLRVEVYTNLVRVPDELWDVFSLDGVQLATSWYSDDRDQHCQVTGRDTWRQTKANVEKALRRGIPLRAGVVDGIVEGQRAAEGGQLLLQIGVRGTGTDTVREFGRGTVPDASQACGNCGHGRAAVLPDGTVTPCPMTRWMAAGNVHEGALAGILGTVTELAGTLPRRAEDCAPHCAPVQDGFCRPSAQEPCDPNIRTVRACNPDDCRPDVFCVPLCSPSACRPNLR
ncbi:MAG TPA: radical SAM protein [Trebonia sp.]|jgi:MoaA/NifB/PqqE/SkfB family radical SAM enzyme